MDLAMFNFIFGIVILLVKLKPIELMLIFSNNPLLGMHVGMYVPYWSLWSPPFNFRNKYTCI